MVGGIQNRSTAENAAHVRNGGGQTAAGHVAEGDTHAGAAATTDYVGLEKRSGEFLQDLQNFFAAHRQAAAAAEKADHPTTNQAHGAADEQSADNGAGSRHGNIGNGHQSKDVRQDHVFLDERKGFFRRNIVPLSVLGGAAYIGLLGLGMYANYNVQKAAVRDGVKEAAGRQ